MIIGAIPMIGEVDETVHIRFPLIIMGKHFINATRQQEHSLDYYIEQGS